MPHNLLGGHIRTFSSPSDPLFFSHHTYVDKLWSIWQDCHEYDKIKKSDLHAKHYSGVNDRPDQKEEAVVNGNYDAIDAPMPFFSQSGDSGTPECTVSGEETNGCVCVWGG